MEKISNYQLASMILLFQIGSSPLFLLASEAKHDAWISVIIGMISGLALLYFVTLPIQRMEPDKNLIEIIYDYFGKILGHVLASAYVIYFAYKSLRNVRDFGELTILYLLPQTPLFIIMLIMMIIAGYAIYNKVEVLFRLAEVLLPVITIFYIGIFTLLFVEGLVHFERLMPFLEEGFKPVINAALPELISFPFGDITLFLMFWKYLNNNRNITKISLLGYCLSGMFLVFTNAVIIAVLGPMAGIGGIPLLMGASLIQIGRVLDRIDPVVLLLMFIGLLIKQMAYYMGATLALATIFRTSSRYTFLPLGAVIFIGALLFRSYTQFIWFGFEQNFKYHFPPFQIWIPICLLLVMKIRGKKKTQLEGGTKHGDSKSIS